MLTDPSGLGCSQAKQPKVGAALGYKVTIVIPRTQSQEKKDAIRLLGAELVEVDAVPYSNPDNYVRYSGRLAEELAKTEPNGAIWANQFDNTANRDAHFLTTGPEIFEQTDGKVDGFICSVGSGGSLAGETARSDRWIPLASRCMPTAPTRPAASRRRRWAAPVGFTRVVVRLPASSSGRNMSGDRGEGGIFTGVTTHLRRCHGGV